MRTILLLLSTCLLLSGSQAQTITDINQHNLSLSLFSGKKIVVVLLPPQPDTLTPVQLLHFQQRYADTLQVIGLVAPEEAQQPAAVATAYTAAIAAGVIISTGTTTRGDNEREVMLQWLSDKNNNRAQQTDLTGSKYFISRTGRLYAQVDARTSLEAPLTNNLARTHVPGE